MFSKFKQLFNIGNGKVSALSDRLAFPSRRVFKQVVGCFFAGIIVGIILIPCMIKMSFAYAPQESFKLNYGSAMFIDSGLEDGVRIGIFIKRRHFEGCEFWSESLTKFISGSVKILDAPIFSSFARIETVSDPNHNETYQNRIEFVDEDSIKNFNEKFNHWLPLLVTLGTIFCWFFIQRTYQAILPDILILN